MPFSAIKCNNWKSNDQKWQRTSKVKDFHRCEWSNVSNAKTGWDIIPKFSQAPCNSLSFVLCKFQSCSLIDSIFSWFKSIFIAFENKHPGGQVSKAVACKAWGHKFESRCKNFRFSSLPKKPDFANFTPSLNNIVSRLASQSDPAKRRQFQTWNSIKLIGVVLILS